MDMKVVEKILKEEDFIHFVDIALIQEGWGVYSQQKNS